MPDDRSTIWNELVEAGRGVVAVIIGDRRAPTYFLLTQRGLVGSFIAFLLATGISVSLPLLSGDPNGHGTVLRAVVLVTLPFALQVAFSALALRQIGRIDGLLPYLVAENWATFFIIVAELLLSFVNFSPDLTLIAVAILAIVVEINVARLVVKLAPLQIALLIVAQLVGVSVGLVALALVMPAPVLAAIGAS